MDAPWVVYGTASWDAPWLTEHNLAAALARRHRVVWVEPPTTLARPLRNGLSAATAAELVRLSRRATRRDGSIDIIQPLALPPLSHPRSRALSRPLVRAQVRRALRTLGVERAIGLTANSFPGLAGEAGERRLVYLVKDAIGAGAALLGRDGGALREAQQRMCRVADQVIAISPELQAMLAASGVQSTVVRHGFDAARASRFSAAPPRAYEGLPRPLLGYTGRIDGRLDFTLLERLADAHPDGTVVLVGPVAERLDGAALAGLRDRVNVRFLPAVSHAQLPRFVAHLDCCLMPYEPSEWIRRAAPLKLWDYLYAGPPLVGTGCEILRDYPPPLSHFAEDHDAFLAAVRRALTDGRAGAAERRAFALANTWDARAEEIERAVVALDAEGVHSSHRTRGGNPAVV